MQNHTFDKLGNMNWVEKRANRERAIRLNGKELYLDLVRAMDSAVHTFNERYMGVGNLAPITRLRPSEEEVFCVSKKIKVYNGARWEEQERYFTCEFKDDESRIASKGNAAPSAAFTIDADENGRVFLREDSGDKEESTIEDASQSILEKFLFRE